MVGAANMVWTLLSQQWWMDYSDLVTPFFSHRPGATPYQPYSSPATMQLPRQGPPQRPQLPQRSQQPPQHLATQNSIAPSTSAAGPSHSAPVDVVEMLGVEPTVPPTGLIKSAAVRLRVYWAEPHYLCFLEPIVQDHLKASNHSCSRQWPCECGIFYFILFIYFFFQLTKIQTQVLKRVIILVRLKRNKSLYLRWM